MDGDSETYILGDEFELGLEHVVDLPIGVSVEGKVLYENLHFVHL